MVCKKCEKCEPYVDPDGDEYSLCAGCLLDDLLMRIKGFRGAVVGDQFSVVSGQGEGASASPPCRHSATSPQIAEESGDLGGEIASVLASMKVLFQYIANHRIGIVGNYRVYRVNLNADLVDHTLGILKRIEAEEMNDAS